MASLTTSTTLPFSSSSSPLIDGKAPRQSASPCVSLPTLPPPSPQSLNRMLKTTNCRKNARNVAAMATGEAPVEVAEATELPEFVKTVQKAWDKVEDKYAMSSLAVAGVVALWGSTGLISAIDRLPLVPGVLELVGIGYTGWFAYQNLVFKPDRDVLIKKMTDAYKDIIGSGSSEREPTRNAAGIEATKPPSF